ncbi:hypothetical protein vBAspPH44_6 [Alteromonas phage vB_AspP-H4/4]|uniref:Uncharacterized protein n=1 Tax=Alteromonas phage vB_AspP-H4/4 TaxID=2928692 RepID=A0A220YL46_9CAUD|nr:hypothetical protein HOR85_gp06 [Alteromonas phage vB_AspP-H4/4]ASL24389.1 hypothetical protein vBAspPH44_6 [Alteromonas phage vB_AspP-H4/4]
MKSRSSRNFRQQGSVKAMKKAYRTEQRQDKTLTPQRSDAMIAGHEFIEAFLSRGKQVVVRAV